MDPSANNHDTEFDDIINIIPDGDALLDVTFETSNDTLRVARKAATPRPSEKNASHRVFKAKIRCGYRVRLSVLKEHSAYFKKLFVDTRFSEAKSVAQTIERLAALHIKPSEAPAEDLPRVKIEEDDDATQSAEQDIIFGDLMRVLHQERVTYKTHHMRYFATLAILADRFDCLAVVRRNLNSSLGGRMKFPATHSQIANGDNSDKPALSKATEETLRQKILVSWLLEAPLKMHAATKELILYGSRRWSLDEEEGNYNALWWNLPHGLEEELHYRRQCILRSIASIQGYFLRLYSSRERQCQLGYDSSASCDSYQLGELVKFLSTHDYLFPLDFSATHLPDAIVKYATTDIRSLISGLKYAPSYQIDRHHTSCGPRRHISPILDFIQTMLTSSAISIGPAWRKESTSMTWVRDAEADEGKIFRFTRSMAANTQPGQPFYIGPDRLALALFTARDWDWLPKE